MEAARVKRMTFKNQIEMYKWIWETRPHISELSGKPLLPEGHPQFIHQFMHVLGKGKFPELRLDPDNILLGLPEEHEHQDRYDRFNEKKEELMLKMYTEK